MSAAASAIGALGSLPSEAGSALSSGAAGTFQDYLDAFSNNVAPTGSSAPQASTLTNAAGNITNSIALFSSPARIAAFIIGIVLIGGGVLMFRQTQTIIRTAGRIAA